MWSHRFWVCSVVWITVSITGLVSPLSGQTKTVPEGATQSPSDAPAAKPPATGDESLRDSLVRKVKEALGSLDVILGTNRDATNQVWRESDAALTRIREENRRALEQANRQVRIVNQHCPNIVLFLLNGVGYGELGAYGQQLIKTPVIDALAAHGTRFTQFYAGSPDSVASRGTLHSGQLTARGEQVGEEWVTVRQSDCTLAELLYQGGYETGLFGIWGTGPIELTGTPNSQGFKTFFGYLNHPAAEDFYPPALWRNKERVPLPGNQVGAKTQYAPDLIAEAAQRFIATECRRPFFMTVAFPMSVSESGQEVPDWSPYADRDWPDRDKARAAMLTRVDRYIGQIVASLQQRRILNRTIIIITSDRGPPHVPAGGEDRFRATAGLRGRAGELYEGGIRVPLIVVWPRPHRVPAENDLAFGTWDVLPTLRDLTSTQRRAPALDGVSVAAGLTTPSDARIPRGSPLYWETHRNGMAQAVRVDDWKGVRFGAEGRWELYDLQSDPGESTDVADAHPAVVERMDRLVKFLRP